MTDTYLRRVGIVTMPTWPIHKEKDKAFITENNVSWFAQRGIDIVPIPFRTKQPEFYMRQIHGLYLQGGPEYDPRYMALIKKLLELAIEKNRRGEYFPVWGTCHGFQSLLISFGQIEKLDDFDSNDEYKTHLIISETEHYKSRMLRAFSREFINYITHGNSIIFFNSHGLTPTHFYKNRSLPSMFYLVAIAKDREGVAECAIIEGRKYPFYGTQFHPEGVPALEPFRTFFINELMKNKKKIMKKKTRSFRQSYKPSLCVTRKNKYYRTFGNSKGYFF